MFCICFAMSLQNWLVSNFYPGKYGCIVAAAVKLDGWRWSSTNCHICDNYVCIIRVWHFVLRDSTLLCYIFYHSTLCDSVSVRHYGGIVELEYLATWSLYGAVFVIIPAATEDLPFPLFLLFWLTSWTCLHDINIYFYIHPFIVSCSHKRYTTGYTNNEIQQEAVKIDI